MTVESVTGGGPGHPGALPTGSSALRLALVPVADALVETAQRRAEQTRLAAGQEAREVLAAARTEAERVIAQARENGRAGAERAAEMRLARTRRDARRTVLAARRRAYDALRRGAVESLTRHATTPAGRRLADRMEAALRQRIGTEATLHRAGPGSLDIAAESGRRRVSLDPSVLVDRVLGTMADEVEHLWS
jgi:vacuolar-type H+-ATPase subunit E/Vma4